MPVGNSIQPLVDWAIDRYHREAALIRWSHPMASPFPGMDPYLEHPSRWSEVHSRLISAIANNLENQLSDAYFISFEKVTLPTSMEVRESYLEVRDIETGDVITAIELLSPVNKRSGEGRRTYEFKRQAILGSQTHFIEIDLLRSGLPMAMGETPGPTDYRLLVSRANDRPLAQLYGFNVEQPIPTIPVPLKIGEQDLDLNLKACLDEIYAQARYARRIDYQTAPVPPLRDISQAWAIDRIQSNSP
jgi:hypothetical protein